MKELLGLVKDDAYINLQGFVDDLVFLIARAYVESIRKSLKKIERELEYRSRIRERIRNKRLYAVYFLTFCAVEVYER